MKMDFERTARKAEGYTLNIDLPALLNMSLTHNFLLAARQQEIAELQTLNGTCELVRRTGELIHALQAERGSASACLTSPEPSSRERWQDKCTMTNTAISHLNSLLSDNLSMVGTSRLYARIALAVHTLTVLSSHRVQVAKLEASAVESTSQYSKIIDALIALIFEAIDATAEPEVSRLLLALFNLIEAKAYAGLERANGVRLLGGVPSNKIDQQTLADLIDCQEQSLARFETFCGEDIRAQWSALQSTLPLHELEKLRRQLLSPNSTVPNAVMNTWFDTCSACIDGLHVVERHMADLIQQACRNRIAETKALLEEQRESLKINSTPSDVWMAQAMKAAAGQGVDHEQRLVSRLNRTLMDLLQQQSADLQTMSTELSSVRAVLEDRKLIERAKGLLMVQQGISEEAAYGLLRQKAMSQHIKITEVANALLAMADFFPTRPN